jgi:hypothetical protein
MQILSDYWDTLVAGLIGASPLLLAFLSARRRASKLRYALDAAFEIQNGLVKERNTWRESAGQVQDHYDAKREELKGVAAQLSRAKIALADAPSIPKALAQTGSEILTTDLAEELGVTRDYVSGLLRKTPEFQGLARKVVRSDTNRTVWGADESIRQTSLYRKLRAKAHPPS